jgi:hypothetical protein
LWSEQRKREGRSDGDNDSRPQHAGTSGVHRWQICSYAFGRRRCGEESSTRRQPGEATTNLRSFAVVRNVLTDVGKIRSHSFPQSNVRL